MNTLDVLKQVCKGILIGLVIFLLVKPFKLVVQKGKDILTIKSEK